MIYSLGNMLSRGGRVAFNPLSLSPALWLSDTGTNAAQWNDLSGNGRHATQAIGASQPAIIANALNGRQVRRFDGVNDEMRSLFALNQPMTAIVAYRSNNTTAAQVVIGNQLTGANLMVHRAGASATAGLNMGVLYAPLGSTANANIFCTIANGANSQVFRNGVLAGTGNAGSNNAAFFSIGSNGALAAYFNGDIAEVLVFPAALSAENRRRIEGYLSVKYNIALS
jgi:hypothetical protein